MPTILTEEQAKARLNSSRNLASRFGRASSDYELETPTEVTIIPLERPGRTNGSPNFTPDEKVTIGARRRSGERLQSVADDFGTTASVVRNIENGKTKSDRKRIDEKVESIQDVALLKLMASLNLIDESKLSKLGAKDLGVFAASMSKVVSNTLPKENNGETVHLHLYAPELRSEQSYQTIEVRASS